MKLKENLNDMEQAIPEIELYETDRADEFDNSVKRFVKKKKFVKLPDLLDSLDDEVRAGVFGDDVWFHEDTPMPYDVYKKRLPNPDANAGKSNGFRVIYAVISEHRFVLFASVYYKKEVTSVSEEYVRAIIEGFILNE
jgi:mRNA-degrading endonuclease RelE of RelBE toxin-antitoxin system